MTERHKRQFKLIKTNKYLPEFKNNRRTFTFLKHLFLLLFYQEQKPYQFQVLFYSVTLKSQKLCFYFRIKYLECLNSNLNEICFQNIPSRKL